MKKCRICLETKEITYFVKGRNICKVCSNNKSKCKHSKRSCEICHPDNFSTVILRKCNTCKINKPRVDFYSKDKKCRKCQDLNRRCSHGLYKRRCKECPDGGQYWCKCGNIKSNCKNNCSEDSGNSICEHNKIRSTCKECGGSVFCKEHNRVKKDCIPCDGSGICIHKRRRQNCIPCRGTQVCPHLKQKWSCYICFPTSRKICQSCQLFQVRICNTLCSICEPKNKTFKKEKEEKLLYWLANNNYDFDYNLPCNKNSPGCQIYYPDFLFRLENYFLILECDEQAHTQYTKECEQNREINIATILGMDCVFIRYNPDSKENSEETKLKFLKERLDYYLCDYVHTISVGLIPTVSREYLFYPKNNKFLK